MAGAAKKPRLHFKAVSRGDVPKSRHGKHNDIVKKILADLDQVGADGALQVPLSQLMAGKEKVRSALNRATRKRGMSVATASDETYLYVWQEPA